jgi:GDP-fucose protein O-fucosyltransferase
MHSTIPLALLHLYILFMYLNVSKCLCIYRYIDEIQCGAARIVAAIRNLARSDDRNEFGQYDAFHIRRGDFQYDAMHQPAPEIYNTTTRWFVPDGRTVYIATDEKNRSYFAPFQDHYNIVFLDNFQHLLRGINPNYYGMIDQLVASKAHVFVGALYSTFTGYINRLRGYHAQQDKIEGYEEGKIRSYYYVPKSEPQLQSMMRNYVSVQKPFWRQEFPVCWRDIDHDIENV